MSLPTLKAILKLSLAAFVLIAYMPTDAFANEEIQKQCFEDLKVSVSATPAFSYVSEQIKNLTYEDVSAGFSKSYANISSFGIDLLSPDFDQRIYSFGRDTGYQHPPFSPFPTYTLSDKWETPAKEFIISEEYVRNTTTNERVFLSCSFLAIKTGSLKKVTAERYLYDGPLSSVLYTSPDSSYKVWYSKNKSHDHTGMEFVGWERMFVYPKATENQFFSRYSVADAFPARTTDDLRNIVSKVSDLQGDKTLLDAPELKGYDTVFALNSYYQAIENSYPKFAEKLALRGVLQYNTVKELLATRGVSEFSALWDTVLDPTGITRYALAKNNGEIVKENGDGTVEKNEESAFYEGQLEKIKNLTLENEAVNLLKTVTERNPIIEPTQPEKELSFWDKNWKNIVVFGGIAFAVLLGLVLVWLRRKRFIHEDISA